MIKLISVSYTCSSCNQPFDSAVQPADLGNNSIVCDKCVMKHYFQVIFDDYPAPDNIIYTYTNGVETKLLNGFIRLICPTKSAILNNI